MSKETLLKELKAAIANDPKFHLDAVRAISEGYSVPARTAEETLKCLIRSNGIHYANFDILNDPRKMIREYNRHVAERIGFAYLWRPEQADARITDAISEFCKQVTKEDFQNLQVYAELYCRVGILDIFDLEEKILSKSK
jgi:hypothetical protein|nr:MAG TPA: hypothetical protein [Bacteriophage sp.]